MHPWIPAYGPQSPFTGEERDTVTAVADALGRSEDPRAVQTLSVIRNQFEILEAMGRVLARFPLSAASRRSGRPSLEMASLVEALCRSTPADFDFQAPARVMPGRALDMTEINFYRLLRYAASELIPEPDGSHLLEQATARMRTVIYTKLVEEVLSDLVSDTSVACTVRERAVGALVELWDERLTYRASKVFPLLQATWEARQRVHSIGGTLMGAQEMFALFRAGCDPRFVEYFTRTDPDEEEVEAFREFLFGKSAEELGELAARMEADGISCLPTGPEPPAHPDQPGTALYAFFRSRFLLATARRLANAPGPKRTAEGYVMIMFLARQDGDVGP